MLWSFLQPIKNTSGRMVQSYKSLKATFLLGTISIINTPPKKSKGIHTYWLPMNQSAQHISGEKISNKVTL